MMLVKQYDKLKKFIPVIAMVVWIWVSFVINAGRNYGLNAYQLIIVGLMLGWTSTWLYEAGKNLLTKNKSEETISPDWIVA
jgi:hypothetical protein